MTVAGILFDYRVLGDPLWDRFNGGADGTRWYYNALADVFSDTTTGRLSDRSADYQMKPCPTPAQSPSN